jgi:hypothetical protein
MRRWKRILLSLLVVLITFFYPLLAPTPHHIDQAHADLIVHGMTKEQVEAIFGVPAGQYDWAEEAPHTRVRVYISSRLRSVHAYAIKRADIGGEISQLVQGIHESPRTSLTWTSRHGSFMVWFDHNELVRSTDSWTAVRIVPPWQRFWNQLWNK